MTRPRMPYDTTAGSQSPAPRRAHDHGARIGHGWSTTEAAARTVAHARSSGLGCAVVRRLADDRGREWRVREVWSASGHALLFQCDVPGVRSEIRRVLSPLESLSDDELANALSSGED